MELTWSCCLGVAWGFVVVINASPVRMKQQNPPIQEELQLATAPQLVNSFHTQLVMGQNPVPSHEPQKAS